MRLYRILLHLYPASFRAEYGEEMCTAFGQRRRETNFALLWLEMLIDLFSNAPRVHFDILRQDLRYAARTLLAAPGFALTAITVTALGIGATTAAFTMVDHVLIRPLPFPDPDRLVRIWESPPNYRHNELSPANYRDLKQSTTSFETFGSFRGLSASMVGAGEPRQINGAS